PVVTALLDAAGATAGLLAGRVVGLPTDTVYGLGASVAAPAAVSQIFELKRRPDGLALPVVVADESVLTHWGATWDPVARRLAASFWPGALTIVVAADPALARLVGSRSGQVGFRVPDHDALRSILADVGPVALTSANRHGEAPCHDANEVRAAFAGSDVAGVFDAGRCDGAVSSVVVIDGDGWRVTRSGAIGDAALREVIGR
ncbi:MAG: L-threonylcarbamoyladenylate synthase, partial [Acidimicrobiales bacterium]